MPLILRNVSSGLKTVYPGLQSHPSHKLFASMINPEYGFGMMTVDAGSLERQMP
jgi:methionine-gamma-lyase